MTRLRTVGLVATIGAAGLLVAGLYNLSHALNNKFCTVKMQHVAFVARCLEDYKRTVGTYPSVFGREPLGQAIRASTSSYTSLFADPGLEYGSDGQRYYLSYAAGGKGSISQGSVVFLLSDGRFLNWPDCIAEAAIKRQESWIVRPADE